MEIPFRGQIDLSVLRRMNRLVLKPSRGVTVTGSIMAFAFLWGLIGVPLTHGEPLTKVMTPSGLRLLFVGVVAYSLFMGPRKVLQSGKLLQDPMTGLVTESGVRIETPHSGQNSWTSSSGPDRPGPGLLYQSIQVCNAFPREFFGSEADWQAFINLVRQRVPLHPPGERKMERLIKVVLLWLVIFIVVLVLWGVFRGGR
ncbi:MAG TPA: hypothetical protein VHC97_10900 [Thermoanaerobaculia bacterium]|jgi:hypothetical protein|nr:hypothetical protein [Thermoanaerobaculia bacterium]